MSTGTINVSVENIFPLIKKFLYSDHEIFLRELVSNATDATLKLKHLTNIGDTQLTGGHLLTGLTIFLLLYVARMLDRKYSQFLTLESLEEKEQE